MCPVTAPIAAPAPPPTASPPRSPTAGEDGARSADREAPAEPLDRAVAGAPLVLLDDRDLAVLVAGDHGGIEVL